MTRVLLKFSFAVLFLGFSIVLFAAVTHAQNSINGIVFDENRRPLASIEVELLDSFERLIRSQKTRGGGFYTFQRLTQGIYYIKVRVGGTSYKEKKLRIDLGDLNSIGGVDVKQVDIFMEIDTQRRGSLPAKTGVVFAQDVPQESKDLYYSASKKFSKKNFTAAEKDLLEALRMYPDYFEALSKLGEVHLAKKNYIEAEKVLQKALTVNTKSFKGFFNLAIAQNSLNKEIDASNSLKTANEINGNSIDSHLLLGIIQRKLKQYEDAKKSLLTAKELGDNKQPDVNWQLAELYYFSLKKLPEAAEELGYYLKNLTKDERKKNPQKIATVKKLILQIRSEATGKS